MQFSSTYQSPLGKMTMTGTAESLTSLYFNGQKGVAEAFCKNLESRPLPVITETKLWLDRYFAGEIPDFTPKIEFITGTPFQQLIWHLLTEIPYGEVVTYKTLAEEAARRLHKTAMSAQAAGNAVGRNPVAIIIPCHRVVGSDGSLTGYAGGIERKAALLELERKGKQR